MSRRRYVRSRSSGLYVPIERKRIVAGAMSDPLMLTACDPTAPFCMPDNFNVPFTPPPVEPQESSESSFLMSVSSESSVLTSESSLSSIMCGECPDGSPECWELVVSGVTNQVCSDCGDYNGVWILKHVSGCIWATDELAACGAAPQRMWVLALSGPNPLSITAQLRAGAQASGNSASEVGMIYTMDIDDFDCEGPNTFTGGGSGNNECNNWPASITIEPIACP